MHRPFVAVCLLLPCFALACASFGTRLEPPDVSLVGLRPLPVEGPFEQRMAITLRIANPNDVPLELDGIDVSVELNDRRLGRALGNERVSIPRLGDGLVELTATTNLLSLLYQAIDLAGESKLEYALRGRAFLANGPGWLRFSREGELTEGLLGRRR